jgi:hypothetical protein
MGFLPATFGALRGAPDQQEKFFTLQEKDYAHPIVSIWNDPGAGTLASARFHAAYALKPEASSVAQAGDPEVVVKFVDGAPAIMERAWGRGRVIQFSSTANGEWNDLPLRPAYLPLMERTLGSILEGQDARLNMRVGTPFEFVCAPDWINKDAIIIRPGEKKETGSLRRIGLVDGVPVLRFDDTGKAGPYEADIKTDPVTVVRFAVQSDPAESNLACLTQPQLDSIAAAAQLVHWAPGVPLTGEATGGSGREWWLPIALLALLLACGEVLLAGTFSAPK